MSQAEKEKWREICQTNTDMHIFMRDWWLDAVCGEHNWDCIIEYSDDKKEGYCVLPFYKVKSHGFNIITQPILTQKIGPYIHLPKGFTRQESANLSHNLLGAILDKIPADIDKISLTLDWHINTGEPFLTRGYNLNTKYTHLITDLSNLDAIYKSFDTKLRTHIRKAEKIVTVVDCPDIQTFYEIDSKTFARQNITIPYSLDFLKHLDIALAKHKARKMWMAIDSQNRIHAVEYLVWDENSAYLLMGGADPELRNSYATNLLVWRAIQYASTVTKMFDFEGSIMPNVTPFNRSYSPIEMPYLSASKCTNRFYNFLWHAKQIVDIYFEGRKNF